MKNDSRAVKFALSGLLFWVCLASGCKPGLQWPLETDAYAVPEGFSLEIVAGPPLVNDPVAVAFDEKGRVWVVEMNGYMRTIDGDREEAPTGQIRVLEDRDHDGRMDHVEVFLDGLVLPRAVLPINGGILYATPPNLWFVEEKDGKPGARTLVDSAYAVGGNVEHQANGLLYALDNWIYSAKSDKRYRYRGGKWEMEKTAFRGQWGISQDDFGRLFYNHNSHPLHSDLVYPGIWERNPYHKPATGFAHEVSTTLTMNPLHPTGVNRGYEPGMLTADGRVTKFTSACGPVIYRGDQWPADYRGIALLAAPEANLLRAERIMGNDTASRGKPISGTKEFLASTDELFRPVSLYNAPDGTLYIVDYHRGIIQHKTYMTGYLREYVLKKNLDKEVGNGRILRLVHTGSTIREKVPNLHEMNARGLAALLSHPNAWHRETAQRLLVERRTYSIVGTLEALAQSGSPQGRIHALWTLEGLEALRPEIIQAALNDSDRNIVLQGIRLALTAGRDHPFSGMDALLRHPDAGIRLHAVALAMHLDWGSHPAVRQVVADSLGVWAANRWFRDALLSGAAGKEPFLQDHSPLIDQALNDMALRKAEALKPRPKSGPDAFVLQSGGAMYGRYCGSCHGREGEGITGVAPPLKGSEWVNGPSSRFVALVLQGVKGTMTVNGITYSDAAIAAGMSGLRHNPYLSSEEVSRLLTYVRQGIGQSPDGITTEDVLKVKELIRDRVAPFTANELLEWKK